MAKRIQLQGIIKSINYRTYLHKAKPSLYGFKDFDVNRADTSGVIQYPCGSVGYSKWVSPKRSRTYPLSRAYNVFNLQRSIAIIPIMKDEGADGECDRLNYSTVSWMSLLGIYIVLTYYVDGQKSMKNGQSTREKLESTTLNSGLVDTQLEEIQIHKRDAYHWNMSLIEKRYTNVYKQALDYYQEISARTGVKMHSRSSHDRYLSKVVKDFDNFKEITLAGSQRASDREVNTTHRFEHLPDGQKATVDLTNFYNGKYHLTVDEFFLSESKYVLQESKNTNSGSLPSTDDIQDGLFKLILYSNIDTLLRDGVKLDFCTRLKLTGKNVLGMIRMPCSDDSLNGFLAANQDVFGTNQQETIKLLNMEASNNRNIEIEVTRND